MTSTALPPVVELDDEEAIEAFEAAVAAADVAESGASSPVADDASILATTPLGQQVGPYLGYVGYFVGAGLISGGIVHYTLDPARYLLVAAAGVVVFLMATVCNEIVLPATTLPRAQLTRVVGGSLLLSLGIGMLSGGIQHFSDFPVRSATLVPLGLLLSFVAFHVRTVSIDVRGAVLGRVGAAVLVLAVGLGIGLHSLADRVNDDSQASGHGHGATTMVVPAATDTHVAEEPAPAPAAGHEDSHGH